MKSESNTVAERVPVACNLSAMSAEQRERHIVLLQQLRSGVEATVELCDGYAFSFSADAELFMAAAEFITLESLCCSFFKFVLEFSHGSGNFTLTLVGPTEAKPIILSALGRQY
jgi:hypothetical protein